MLLSTDGVKKVFGGLVAVKDVSIDIEKGEIYGIIGPNGAGKSTLLNCISGVYRPDGGQVYYKGKKITGLKPHTLCKMGIGRTHQIVRSFPKLTALENVKVAVIFGNPGKKPKNPERKAAEMLDAVGFPLSHDVMAGSLSTVQLKYLELARALASDCDLLLLDEVAAGLTPYELPEIMALIKQVRDRGVTIIVIEHVMKFIMGICDRIGVISFGEKIAEGLPKEIMQNEMVIKAYFGDELVH